MKKLCNQRGETLIETLSALLIATLVLLFLGSSIVAAARLNAATKTADRSFQYAQSSSGRVTIEITGENEYSDHVTVDHYQTSDGYCYYQKQEATP